MPPSEGLVVVRSKIHGYGVVTQRRFRAGERVLVGDGVVYPQDVEFDDTYALILPAEDGGPALGDPPAGGWTEDDVFFFDLVDQSRWINHSCDPNTRVEGAWLPEEGSVRAWWVALRDIEIGEELSYDYAFAPDIAEPCNCGAATCRGLIVDPDLIDEVPERLRPHLRASASAQAAS